MTNVERSDTTRQELLRALSWQQMSRIAAHAQARSSSQHLVQFYEDESSIVNNVAYLAARTLASGDSSVVVATEAHLEQIQQRLASSDLDAALNSGRYVTVDAAQALSKFMVNGQPHKAKFDDVVGGIVGGAAKNSANGFVFAFGDMVGLLCAANNPDAAVRLKQLWNSLAELTAAFVYCSAWAAQVGVAAPDFTGTDSNGQSLTLSKYRGRFVVLEWHNQGCPTRANIARAGTWRRCSANGRPKGWCG